MFRVDDPRSEPRVLHELRKKKMAEDAESNIAFRFVDENDCREISAKAVSAKRKLISGLIFILLLVFYYSTKMTLGVLLSLLYKRPQIFSK